MDYTLTIPREDIEEAQRRGYSVLRTMAMHTGDGLSRQWTQVRTGFNPETGSVTWEDLYPVQKDEIDVALERAVWPKRSKRE